jgi:hypothetical protein
VQSPNRYFFVNKLIINLCNYFEMVWSCRMDGQKEIDKDIYETDLSGNAVRGKPRQKFLDLVKSTRNGERV